MERTNQQFIIMDSSIRSKPALLVFPKGLVSQGYFQALFYHQYTVVNTQSSIEFLTELLSTMIILFFYTTPGSNCNYSYVIKYNGLKY